MNKFIYKLQKKLFRSYESEIDYETMKRMLKKNNKILVIDVRTRDEFKHKHLEGAINIPMQYITERIELVTRNRQDVIVVYCEYGGRSQKALAKLKKMGYVNVYNLRGGIEAI